MKRLGALFLFIAAALCGCGGGGGEGAAPEVEAMPRIHYHIGMFQGYDPPWVDHSRWMKPSAIQKEERENEQVGAS